MQHEIYCYIRSLSRRLYSSVRTHRRWSYYSVKAGNSRVYSSVIAGNYFLLKKTQLSTQQGIPFFRNRKTAWDSIFSFKTHSRQRRMGFYFSVKAHSKGFFLLCTITQQAGGMIPLFNLCKQQQIHFSVRVRSRRLSSSVRTHRWCFYFSVKAGSNRLYSSVRARSRGFHLSVKARSRWRSIGHYISVQASSSSFHFSAKAHINKRSRWFYFSVKTHNRGRSRWF